MIRQVIVMNRNVESHFAVNPTNIDISRSRFDRSHSVKTTFNVGELVPFYVDEVLPGDTFNVKTSKVIRMQTLLTPMMDNIYLDTYFFFVPNRIIWKHWKEFNGENTSGPWVPQVEYTVPQIKSPELGWSTGTIADYFGMPVGVPNLSVNALPFRAYAKICQEWFNDENLGTPVVQLDDDSTVTGINDGDNKDVNKGGKPFMVFKYHDYFTSCLPAPQKGPDVQIPVGSARIPVYTQPDFVPNTPEYEMTVEAPRFYMPEYPDTQFHTYFGSTGNSHLLKGGTATEVKSINDTGEYRFAPNNLFAVMDDSIGMSSINTLRLAFQIQKAYEKDARGGTRYIELLKAHFGVTSPDSRLQRPEYLGGNRVPITINQVIQQSSTTESSPQGNVAGMSLTTDHNSDFVKSFTEHGFVIGLCVARYDHTYQQGIERFWSRKSRFDYYWPVFANIGEQAVKNREIYAQGSEAVDSDTGLAYDDEVFGYQEAWADYRYKPNRTSGEMRSAASTSLDVWHLGDDYASLPYLSEEWAVEDPTTVDRVLAVTSAVSDQIFMDVYIQNQTTRPMPMYSIPGLIDHH